MHRICVWAEPATSADIETALSVCSAPCKITAVLWHMTHRNVTSSGIVRQKRRLPSKHIAEKGQKSARSCQEKVKATLALVQQRYGRPTDHLLSGSKSFQAAPDRQ